MPLDELLIEGRRFLDESVFLFASGYLPRLFA